MNVRKSRFVEMFGDPAANTHGLPVEKLSNLGVLERGKSKHRPRNAPELRGGPDGPYPLVQTGDITNAGLYLNTYEDTYTELGLQQSRMWPKGTLCITIAANIAQTAILAIDACFPDSVVGFTPGASITNVFLHYWFSFFQGILEEQAPQAAQKNINLKILSELGVITPPIELQQEFSGFVAQVDKSEYLWTPLWSLLCRCRRLPSDGTWRLQLSSITGGIQRRERSVCLSPAVMDVHS